MDLLRSLRRLARPVEVAQIRRLGRSGISLFARTPVLVLETTGRHSGATRATPLAYHRDRDGSLLVVGGAGGQTRIPDWVHNLRADPRASVVVDRRRVAVRAVELSGDEREPVWAELRSVWPRIDAYQRKAGRAVPVFRFVA